MLLLNSTSDAVRLVTGSAANSINVHVSWMDTNGTTVTLGGKILLLLQQPQLWDLSITGSGVTRNVRGIYATNDSTGTNCTVAIEHTDGTNVVELMQFILLPGENFRIPRRRFLGTS